MSHFSIQTLLNIVPVRKKGYSEVLWIGNCGDFLKIFYLKCLLKGNLLVGGLSIKPSGVFPETPTNETKK